MEDLEISKRDSISNNILSSFKRLVNIFKCFWQSSHKKIDILLVSELPEHLRKEVTELRSQSILGELHPDIDLSSNFNVFWVKMLGDISCRRKIPHNCVTLSESEVSVSDTRDYLLRIYLSVLRCFMFSFRNVDNDIVMRQLGKQ